MIFYNVLTELTMLQVGVCILLNLLILSVVFLFVKPKITSKRIVWLFFIALLLSLFSTNFTQGYYSGMGYQEKMGWPLQFRGIWRSMEVPLVAYEANSFSFDWLKLGINTLFWLQIVFSFILALDIFENKKKRLFISMIGIMMIVLLFPLWFSYENTTKDRGLEIGEKQSSSTEANLETSEVQKRRLQIESKYPQYKDFENQSSFAGKSVVQKQVKYDYYFGYVTHGSGLPIVQATCFKVDSMGKVMIIGTFPDPLDSYAGYPDINPITCQGVK